METTLSEIRKTLVLMKDEIDKTVQQEIGRNKDIAQSFVMRANVNKARETSPEDRRIQRTMNRAERKAERLRVINEQ